MATPAAKAPLEGQDLQIFGYHRNESWVINKKNKDISTNKQILLVQNFLQHPILHYKDQNKQRDKI